MGVSGDASAEKEYQGVRVKAKEESGIEGSFSKPIIPDDVASYVFHAEHIEAERDHSITRKMANQYIKDTFLVAHWNGTLGVLFFNPVRHIFV